MINTTTEQRITCAEPNHNNPYAKPKLLATITRDGLQVWCKYCKVAHFISREACIAAWQRGESAVQCEQGEQVL